MSDIETRIEGLLSQNYQVGSKEYWQARAEAAEKVRDEAQMAWIRTGELRDRAEARAEAAEKEAEEFRRALDKGPAASIEAQAEINHWKSRAEAAEKALREIATECSTFPIKNGLAFRCESIARAALGAKHTGFAIPLREPPAPALLVTVGDRWLNADSGTVYEWDGTTWVPVRCDETKP